MSESLTFADLHSHVVPGVDDGSRSLADSLEGIGRMWEMGVRRMVTTPHLDGSLTRDRGALELRLSAVDEAFRTLHAAAAERFPELELGRGHEVMLDIPDPDLSDPRMHLGETSFVLIEWPRLMVPPATKETVARLRNGGVTPVIAHPERYRGITQRLGLAEVWRKEGAVLQVNYGSLLGRFGAEARSVAFRLLERGWVDCLSSDFHGRPHLEVFLDRGAELFARRDAMEVFELLAATNTNRITDGKLPLEVPPIRPDRRLFSRLRGLLGA